MSIKHVLRALVALCVVLTYRVRANKFMLSKNLYFDENKWMLVPADNKPVTTLSDLNDGVYSIQLSGERSNCGSTVGQGMMMPCVCVWMNMVFDGW